MHKIKIKRGTDNQIRVNIHAGNGSVVLVGEGYKRVSSVKKMIDGLVRAIKSGQFEIHEMIAPSVRLGTGTLIRRKLARLIVGLLFISDAAHLFEAVAWRRSKTLSGQPVTFNEIRHDLPRGQESLSYYEISPKEFFHQVFKSNLTPGAKKQYQALERFFKNHLENATVFRIGSVEVNIYLVGTAPNGDLCGVKTKSSEN